MPFQEIDLLLQVNVTKYVYIYYIFSLYPTNLLLLIAYQAFFSTLFFFGRYNTCLCCR